jgi:hypothetical protein
LEKPLTFLDAPLLFDNYQVWKFGSFLMARPAFTGTGFVHARPALE